MTAKIMVIDDEQDIRMYLMAALEDNGYQACDIGERKSVLDAVRDENPDLIMLDIMMPKRSGVSIYKEFRTSKTFRDIPVVIISGMLVSKDSIEEEFKKLIGDDTIPLPNGFVEKPIKLPALLRLVDTLSR
jgi:twitching motility two-component system response regulator PilH